MRDQVIAVVSSFEKVRFLRLCLKSLFQQSKKPNLVIVVDGSRSDAVEDLIKNEFPQVIYIRLHDDVGGAGQFYIGFKVALKLGFDYLWIMDDDVIIIDKNALSKMLDVAKYYENRGVKIEAVIPAQIKLLQNGLVIKNCHSIFVAGLISRQIIENIGFPDPNYFVYYDDVDYLYRIMTKNYRIICIEPIHKHFGWSYWDHICIKLRGKRSCLPLLSGRKMFYLTRNAIVFATRYKQARFLVRVLSGSFIRGILYALILRNLKIFLYTVAGIIVGVLRLGGKIF